MKKITYIAIPLFAFMLAGVALSQDSPPGQPENQPPDDIETLKKLVAQQKEQIDKLTQELNEAKETLKKLTQGQTEPENQPVPEKQPAEEQFAPVEGRITEVRMDRKLVLINLGSACSLKGGDLFEVIRTGKKIGAIKICVIVDKDLSNAEVVKSETDFIPGDTVVKIASAPVEEPEVVSPPREELVQRKTVKINDLPETDAEKLGKRLEVLEGLYADLAKQVERLQLKVDNGAKVAAEENVRNAVPVAPEPRRVPKPSGVEVKIADITEKYVYICAGHEQGVKEGDIFLIKRGEREVATVKVTKLIEDMCKAEIVSKNTTIGKQDIAVLQ